PYQDLKYSYSENLRSDYLLTGDPTVLRRIGYISWGMEFGVDLRNGGEAFTERHRAFALLAHAVDYELTGSAHELGVINAGIQAMRTRQTSPLPGNGPDRLLQLPARGRGGHVLAVDVEPARPSVPALLRGDGERVREARAGGPRALRDRAGDRRAAGRPERPDER